MLFSRMLDNKNLLMAETNARHFMDFIGSVENVLFSFSSHVAT